jgi:hypothetical protein
MESKEIYKSSYNYLDNLCKRLNSSEIDINYNYIDAESERQLRELVYHSIAERIKDLAPLQANPDTPSECKDAYNYLLILRRRNTTDHINIESNKLDKTSFCLIHDNIYKFIVRRKIEMYHVISKIV